MSLKSSVEVPLEEDEIVVERSKLSLLESRQRAEREKLVVWRRPVATLRLLLLASAEYVHSIWLAMWRHLGFTMSCASALALCALVYAVDGAHQAAVGLIEFYLVEVFLWWCTLGVLSSVGLGTGLHTFMLYLGPFIAKVTMTATECGSLDFDTHGDSSFLCRDDDDNNGRHDDDVVTFWGILGKVQLAAIIWGFGTAAGELPPYFVARAARLARQRHAELEEVDGETGLLGSMKRWVATHLKDLGFFGIALFASIPNPLFDLAGLTCGHVGVPFWTFFGATVLGKAIVKVHLQAAFVITMFNVQYLARLVDTLESLLGALGVDADLAASLAKQRAKFHRDPGQMHADDVAAAAQGKHPLAIAWDMFLFVAIGYFLLSIAHSLAQNHQAKLDAIANSQSKRKR
jgi:vacuole membrane protein 1